MVSRIFSPKVFRQAVRWLIVAASGTGLWSGCATDFAPTPAPPVAPSTAVRRLEAYEDAELITGLSRDRFTLIGSGDSMLPVYGENTVLVIAKMNYAELKPGMQAAYTSKGGAYVVHVLIEKDAAGWRVKGLNNEVEDYERVTPSNLIGVVYAAFTTDGKGGLGN